METNTIRTENIRQLLRRMEELYALAIELGVDCGIVASIKNKASIIEPYFIIDLVQRKLGVDISKKSRKLEVVEARRLAVYLLHRHSRLSLERIAQYVNLADHSGVIYHISKMNDRIACDERIRVLVHAFEKDINDFYEKKNINEGNGI